MNLAKINELRANMNLPALAGNPNKADAAKRRRDNLAKRAQESRDLKSKRASRGK